jgi:hypothetical protein
MIDRAPPAVDFRAPIALKDYHLRVQISRWISNLALYWMR